MIRDPSLLQYVRGGAGRKWNVLNFKRLSKVRVIIFENIFAIVVPVDLSCYIFGSRALGRDLTRISNQNLQLRNLLMSSLATSHFQKMNLAGAPLPGEHLGLFGGKNNIKFSLPLPPTKHDTH